MSEESKPETNETPNAISPAITEWMDAIRSEYADRMAFQLNRSFQESLGLMPVPLLGRDETANYQAAVIDNAAFLQAEDSRRLGASIGFDPSHLAPRSFDSSMPILLPSGTITYPRVSAFDLPSGEDLEEFRRIHSLIGGDDWLRTRMADHWANEATIHMMIENIGNHNDSLARVLQRSLDRPEAIAIEFWSSPEANASKTYRGGLVVSHRALSYFAGCFAFVSAVDITGGLLLTDNEPSILRAWQRTDQRTIIGDASAAQYIRRLKPKVFRMTAKLFPDSIMGSPFVMHFDLTNIIGVKRWVIEGDFAQTLDRVWSHMENLPMMRGYELEEIIVPESWRTQHPGHRYWNSPLIHTNENLK